MEKEDITPRDKDGKKHGYWEYYYCGGQLCFKGCYVNDKPHGYWVSSWDNGKIQYTEYNIR